MSDVQRIFVAQGLRAFAYGLGSVLLGLTLEERGWSSTEVGALLTAVVAGTALMSVVIGAFGDRFGRRRSYALLFVGLVPTNSARRWRRGGNRHCNVRTRDHSAQHSMTREGSPLQPQCIEGGLK